MFLSKASATCPRWQEKPYWSGLQPECQLASSCTCSQSVEVDGLNCYYGDILSEAILCVLKAFLVCYHGLLHSFQIYLFIFYFMCFSVYLHVCLCTTFVSGAFSGQMRLLGPLVLGIVNLHVGAGTVPRSSPRAVSALSHGTISPAPIILVHDVDSLLDKVYLLLSK